VETIDILENRVKEVLSRKERLEAERRMLEEEILKLREVIRRLEEERKEFKEEINRIMGKIEFQLAQSKEEE